MRAALAARCLLAALALSGAGGGAAHAAGDDLLGALKRVEAVRIEGNRAVDEGTIRSVLRVGGTDFLGLRGRPLFRPDFLRTDVLSIQTLYLRRGFPDATATASADSGARSDRVVVTYRVVEGPRVHVRAVAIDSASVFPPDRLRGVMRLRPGVPYDPVQVPLDRAALAELYAQRGHFPAITTRVDRDGAVVDIRFTIEEGPAYHIGAVAVSGVSRVDTSAVRREVLLRPGDLYRRDRLVESSERLSGTGLFTTVEIQPAPPDSQRGAVDLHVLVRERKPRWVEGAVGTGTAERIRLTGQWGHRNLSGDGKALTAQADVGWSGRQKYRTKGELAFVEPWLVGTRTRGRVAVSYERGFVEFSDRTYIQEAAGVSFGVSRDFFTARARVSAVFDNTWTREARVISRDTSSTADDFFLAPYLPRLTVSFDQDRRDDPLFPRSGAINNLTVQFAGVLRENTGRYMKFEALSGGHLPLGRRTTLALRARGGIIRPVGPGPGGPAGTLARVPATDRYRVGGTATVRGYHDNGIDGGVNGGILLGVVNLELRRRLFGAIGGTLFVDGGNVWSDPARVRLRGVFSPTGVERSYALDDVHWSYGAGLSVATPVGPLRLEYGRRFHVDESDIVAGRTRERDGVHFAIGYTF